MGYIKLFRKIQKDRIWSEEKFSKGQAWVDLLLRARFAPYRFLKRGIWIELKPGQLAESQETLAREWKWSRDKVRRFLNCLEIDGKIRQQKTRLISIVSIVNWAAYQQDDTSNNTTDKTTTYKKGKKNNNAYSQNNLPEQRNTQDEVAMSIFLHWNDKKVVIHKVAEKFLPAVQGALKHYTPDEIKQAINNYAMVVHDSRFYWSHKWGLDQFLQQKNGIDRFLPVNFNEKDFYCREYVERLNKKKTESNIA